MIYLFYDFDNLFRILYVSVMSVVVSWFLSTHYRTLRNPSPNPYQTIIPLPSLH